MHVNRGRAVCTFYTHAVMQPSYFGEPLISVLIATLLLMQHLLHYSLASICCPIVTVPCCTSPLQQSLNDDNVSDLSLPDEYESYEHDYLLNEFQEEETSNISTADGRKMPLTPPTTSPPTPHSNLTTPGQSVAGSILNGLIVVSARNGRKAMISHGTANRGQSTTGRMPATL